MLLEPPATRLAFSIQTKYSCCQTSSTKDSATDSCWLEQNHEEAWEAELGQHTVAGAHREIVVHRTCNHQHSMRKNYLDLALAEQLVLDHMLEELMVVAPDVPSHGQGFHKLQLTQVLGRGYC